MDHLRSGVRDPPGQYGETPSLLKIQKLAGHGGQITSVIPATTEAEAGELLEPGRWKLQWAKIVPLYSSCGDRVRLHVKKKKMCFSPVHLSHVNLFLRPSQKKEKQKKKKALKGNLSFPPGPSMVTITKQP